MKKNYNMTLKNIAKQKNIQNTITNFNGYILNEKKEFIFLEDKINGKKIEWEKNKKENIIIGDIHKYGADNKLAKIYRTEYLLNKSKDEIKHIENKYLKSIYNRHFKLYDCATFLTFNIQKDIATGEESKTLKTANFCKGSTCPHCIKRRSLKKYAQVQKTFELIDSDPRYSKKYKVIFLTLTVKNVTKYKLDKTVDNMKYAFEKFLKLKKIKDINIGTINAMECTYNKKTDEYHPHYHVLMLVPEDYYDKNKNLYINQIELENMWQQSLKADYKPQVNIKKVKKITQKTIAEMTKYTVKHTEVIQYKDKHKKIIDYDKSFEVLNVLDSVFFGRNSFTTSGIITTFMSLVKKYVPKDELINTINQELKQKNDKIIIGFQYFRYNTDVSKYCLHQNIKIDSNTKYDLVATDISRIEKSIKKLKLDIEKAIERNLKLKSIKALNKNNFIIKSLKKMLKELYNYKDERMLLLSKL